MKGPSLPDGASLRSFSAPTALNVLVLLCHKRSLAFTRSRHTRLGSVRSKVAGVRRKLMIDDGTWRCVYVSTYKQSRSTAHFLVATSHRRSLRQRNQNDYRVEPKSNQSVAGALTGQEWGASANNITLGRILTSCVRSNTTPFPTTRNLSSIHASRCSPKPNERELPPHISNNRIN